MIYGLGSLWLVEDPSLPPWLLSCTGLAKLARGTAPEVGSPAPPTPHARDTEITRQRVAVGGQRVSGQEAAGGRQKVAGGKVAGTPNLATKSIPTY